MKKVARLILFVAGGLLVLFLLIQLIPYGRNHTNPPVVSELKWDSPATLALAQRACFDCHSNETVWPWYSNVAPVSWLVYADVAEGRRRLNFSDWNRGFQPSIGEISGIIQEGEMPPFQYLLMHPNAKLTAAEKQSLIDGLRNSTP